MTLQFVNPWVLFLLWLIPLTGLWWTALSRRRERSLAIFMSGSMQKKLRPVSTAVRFAWQGGVVLTGLFLLLIAAARPQWGMKEVTVYQRGRDLVIALDVSRSMLANDVHPNRLRRAKADIMDLIKELRGDRAALLAFRHKAVLLCPLTTDYAYLRQALDAVDINSAPRGETDIGDAIAKALDAFESEEGAHKAVILISDGEDLTGKALIAAEKAGERNIPIFTVGLGSRKGSKIPDQDKQHAYARYQNKEIVTKLDDEALDKIARVSGGAYIPVGTASMATTTLGMLYRKYLRNISAQDFEEVRQKRYIERYQYFLLPGFLCMLAGAFLSRGRLQKAGSREQGSGVREEESEKPALKDLNVPQQPLKTLIILTAFLLNTADSKSQTNIQHLTSRGAGQVQHVPRQSGAQRPTPNTQHLTPASIPPGREGARIAQKLYMKGKYDEAATAYLEAAKSSSRQSQRDFRYNAAAALFKAKKYKESADILRDLARLEKDNRTATAMGLGSSLYRAAELGKESDAEHIMKRAELLRESGEAFRQAARTQPDNELARHNLAVLLNQLPEAEEQAKIAELMTEYEQVPAFQIIDNMLMDQRELLEDIPRALTDNTPNQIGQLEDLAKRQKTNSDLWIPLKGKLLNAMGQTKGPQSQGQMAALDQFIEATRDTMLNSSARLRDLDPQGHSSAARSEAQLYHLWKGMAPYQKILQEDLWRQTNAISMTRDGDFAPQSIQPEQSEALDLTSLFVERFSAAVPAGGEPRETDKEQEPESHNAHEGISAQDRQQILELAEQANGAQKLAAGLLEKGSLPESLSEQHRSLALLKQIEKLLPKQQNQQRGDGQQDQERQDEQDQAQQQEEEQTQENSEDQKSPSSSETAEPEEPDTSGDESSKKDEPEEDAGQDQEKVTPKEIKRLLERAIRREREHESEKRRRNSMIPLPPLGRDW